MAAAVAGKVLGPRPGKAICSFWQGTVEIVLRSAVTVLGAIPVLVCGAVILANPLGFIGETAFLVALSALVIIVEILFILLRVLNIGLINLKIKIFLAVDIALSILFALGYLAGGVAAAVSSATDNRVIVDNLIQPLIAETVFSFIAALLCLILAVWSIFFIIKDWNKKVVEYTLKDAVTG